VVIAMLAMLRIGFRIRAGIFHLCSTAGDLGPLVLQTRYQRPRMSAPTPQAAAAQ
jgi:hypothetical protein